MAIEESQHAAPISGGIVSAQVHVSRALNEPELLRIESGGEQGFRLCRRRVSVEGAGGDEHGTAQVPDMVDRSERRGVDAEPRPQLQKQKRSQRRSQGTGAQRNSILDRRSESTSAAPPSDTPTPPTRSSG